MRQLADLRRKLGAAEDALAEAHAASKRAEEAFDAAERVLDAAREDRAQEPGAATPPGRRMSGPVRPRTGSHAQTHQAVMHALGWEPTGRL